MLLQSSFDCVPDPSNTLSGVGIAMIVVCIVIVVISIAVIRIFCCRGRIGGGELDDMAYVIELISCFPLSSWLCGDAWLQHVQ